MIAKYFIHNGQPNIQYVQDGGNFALPQGAVEYQTFEAFKAAVESLESSKPRYSEFFDACYTIPGFTAQIASNPAWLAIQRRIEKGDFDTALEIWGLMTVAPEMKAAMLTLAQQCNLDQPVIDALS